MAPLRTEIGNGDQVEILTSTDGTPSPTWENWVVTGKARARIRQFIRGERREEFVKLGHAMLDHAYREIGYTPEEDPPQKALKHFGADTLDGLEAMIGSGGIQLAEVVKMLVPEEMMHDNGLDNLSPGDVNIVDFSTGQGGDGEDSDAIAIRGLTPGMAVHYANCCHPLPGDKIVGILTPGKGVTVHTKDCETLESFADTPERWMEVAWDLGPQQPEGLVGRINLIVSNERGALGTLTTVIAQNLGNIHNLKITSRSADFYEMLVDIEVESTKHLNDIIAALRAMREISSVTRAQA
jgi:GTP pyrophosphokinase